MKPVKIIKILKTASKLKENTRHSWLPSGRRESVAEHSWRLAMFAYFMKDEFPDVDINKVITMCLFHDMGEAFTGDIPSFMKTDNDERIENEALFDWFNSLPPLYKSELSDLYIEAIEQKTQEAKLFKALDKLEAAISHNEDDIRTWLPLEYDLNPDYGYKECQFSPYLQELKEEVRQNSLDKIKNAKNPCHT